MSEADISKLKRLKIRQRNRILRLRILGNREDGAKVLQRDLSLPVSVDDVAELLQRAEDEERVNEQREELTDGDLLREDQIQHEEKNARPQQVHECSLNEAETPQVPHLLQLQLKDFVCGRVETQNFLIRESQTLHQLDIAERLGRRSCQRGRLCNYLPLNHLDA